MLVIEGCQPKTRLLAFDGSNAQFEVGIRLFYLVPHKVFRSDVVLCHQIDRIHFGIDIQGRLDSLGAFKDETARHAGQVHSECEDRAKLCLP